MDVLLFQVHDILHFLPTTEPDMMRFIFATEETGFRHLYLYTVQVAASVIKGTSFTDGTNCSPSCQLTCSRLILS